jgi:antitoxin YqcF
MRAVADFLKGRLAGRAETRAYYDDSRKNVVAVVEAMGTPHESLATFATASLHATENLLDSDDVRVELLAVGMRETTDLANVVATAAFYVLKDRWLAAPGVVFPNLVHEYLPRSSAHHVMWTEPFDFDGLSTFTTADVDHPIHMLQAVPITDREYGFLRSDGFDALEQALLAAEIRHYDLERPSAV